MLWLMILLAAFSVHWEWRQGQPTQAVVDEVYRHNHDYMVMENDMLINFTNALMQGIAEKEADDSKQKK